MPIEAASAPSARRFQPQPQPVHAFLSDLPDDIGGRSRPLLADGRENRQAGRRHRLLVEVVAKSLRYKRKMGGLARRETGRAKPDAGHAFRWVLVKQNLKYSSQMRACGLEYGKKRVKKSEGTVTER
jgi:hypothetical protein